MYFRLFKDQKKNVQAPDEDPWTNVSVAGFEPTTSTTPKWRATGLRYTL